MSDKATLLREADRAFGELHRAIGGLTEDQAHEVWFGTWGVREILIHISGWHQAMTPALERVAKGEAPYPPGTYDDADAWNARFVDQDRGVKVADVLAKLDATHREFVDTAARVPAPLFAPGGSARDLFDGSGPAHYREHVATIQEWRQSSPR